MSAGTQRCDAPSPASTTLGGVSFKCSLSKGHDCPLPVEDWAHCSTCGGTDCKRIGWYSDHRFTPTVTGYTYQPHRFYVDWPSAPAIPAGVVGQEGEKR